MSEFINSLTWPIAVGAVCLLVVAGVIWLVTSLDRLRYRDEYSTKGSTGEQSTYLSLVNKFGFTPKQILRNVYIPTKNGTTEIDILVVSKKGLLVFECKNYTGTIYGDGHRKYWVQYLGGKKFHFLNPVWQNRAHVRGLKNLFADIDDLPIIPFVVTTGNAKWKLRNVEPGDHVLYWTGQHLESAYNGLPNWASAGQLCARVYDRLKLLERPDEKIRTAHIDRLQRH